MLPTVINWKISFTFSSIIEPVPPIRLACERGQQLAMEGRTPSLPLLISFGDAHVSDSQSRGNKR